MKIKARFNTPPLFFYAEMPGDWARCRYYIDEGRTFSDDKSRTEKGRDGS